MDSNRNGAIGRFQSSTRSSKKIVSQTELQDIGLTIVGLKLALGAAIAMKPFQKLLLAWIVVWLPFAGALAVAIPLTGPIGIMSAPSITVVDGPSLSGPSCHGIAKSGKLDFGQGCEHCALCHLAGALVMPEIPWLAKIVPGNIYIAGSRALPPSFVPELISPPPRAPALIK